MLAEGYGEDSYDVAYCDILIAQEQLALSMEVTTSISSATQILLNTLGENHPYTKKALALQSN